MQKGQFYQVETSGKHLVPLLRRDSGITVHFSYFSVHRCSELKQDEQHVILIILVI